MVLALTAEQLGFERDESDNVPLEVGATARAANEIDASTLAACQAGDSSALRRFVSCYQHQVFAFLSRMTGAGPHVEDLAQEVFIRAYRALPRFKRRSDARPSTWLLTIAFRLVQDQRKKRRLRVVPLTDEHTEQQVVSTPETEGRRRELAAAFERAAAQLSEEQRAVVVLAHFHGLSMAQIAELTGIPKSTAKTRLYRARERMKQLLSAIWEAH